MTMIRHPVVAGAFYPADPDKLANMIRQFLDEAIKEGFHTLPLPKAIIAPHAGYVYSGVVAASAYACLEESGNNIKRVAVLAPSHRYPFQGLAVSAYEFFVTPLGQIKVDTKTEQTLAKLDFVMVEERAYAQEHALEVQLPFLQTVLKDFALIPIIVGQATPNQVAQALEVLWQDEGTLIVISSDLSHFYDYATANQMDKETADAIVALKPNDIGLENACGRLGIQGMLHFAQQKGWHAKLLDLRNSGDTAGSKDQVVGYGAFHIG